MQSRALVVGGDGQTRGIAPGEAPCHASLACEEFLASFGLAPIEPFDVVDAVLGMNGGLRPSA